VEISRSSQPQIVIPFRSARAQPAASTPILP
jgi:hypothetical protein